MGYLILALLFQVGQITIPDLSGLPINARTAAEAEKQKTNDSTEPPLAIGAFDQAKFEALNRAAKSVQAATSIGITYPDFGKQLQSFATELSLTSDRIKTDGDKKLLEMYRTVLADYKDSLLLWSIKIKSSDKLWLGQIMISVGNQRIPELEVLVSKYSLPTTKYNNIRGGWIGTSPDGIQKIWVSADEDLKKAVTFYLSQN
jgi:hypothetical protein